MAWVAPTRALEVDRRDFTLRVWRKRDSIYEVERAYRVAVGAAGFATPKGFYTITSKSRAPEWLVPDSDWAVEAGLVPGTRYSATDPRNPIKARWLGIHDGVGIHGTDREESIGTRASHGCVRMRIGDVIELYPLIRRGTLVHIV